MSVLLISCRLIVAFITETNYLLSLFQGADLPMERD